MRYLLNQPQKMLKKVKKWLGIEGVKLELVLPEELDLSSGKLIGKIQFYSMHEQTVSRLKIRLLERYTRGRKKSDKVTDEFQLGDIDISKQIHIPAGEVVEVEFKLPFTLVKSEMDSLEDKNFVLGKLVKTAKWISGVQSEYRVEAEADVIGTPLNPFDKKNIHII